VRGVPEALPAGQVRCRDAPDAPVTAHEVRDSATHPTPPPWPSPCKLRADFGPTSGLTVGGLRMIGLRKPADGRRQPHTDRTPDRRRDHRDPRGHRPAALPEHADARALPRPRPIPGRSPWRSASIPASAAASPTTPRPRRTAPWLPATRARFRPRCSRSRRTGRTGRGSVPERNAVAPARLDRLRHLVQVRQHRRRNLHGVR
jgi:hypothetical protein